MRKIVLIFAIVLILTLLGGCLMNMLNPNNKMNYRIYEENEEWFYKNLDKEKMKIHFSDELALIHEYRTVWGRRYVGLDVWKYINRKGNVVLNPKVYRADSFSEGLAAVIPAEGDKWGYINKKGDVVIDARYDLASMFKNGEATVHINGNDGKWVVINTKGEIIRELDELENWESDVQGIPDKDTTFLY